MKCKRCGQNDWREMMVCAHCSALPPVRSEPLFCRCGAALIETSNGHYVCSFVQTVERKRQNVALKSADEGGVS